MPWFWYGDRLQIAKLEMSTTPIELHAIGYVRTDVPDDEIPRRRRSMISDVILEPEYADALHGIDSYSHLIILFWMHRFAKQTTTLITHPRGNESLPPTGVLAARGRNRPNPIGLAVVELLEHDDARLTVKRLDAYDGTPVLDIKPYDHHDIFTEIREPEWLAKRRP